jgi:hypothetical protein
MQNKLLGKYRNQILLNIMSNSRNKAFIWTRILDDNEVTTKKSREGRKCLRSQDTKWIIIDGMEVFKKNCESEIQVE